MVGFVLGVIAALTALIHVSLEWMRREFLPRTEPYRQSKLYANCQSSLTIVVLTELLFNICRNTVNP